MMSGDTSASDSGASGSVGDSILSGLNAINPLAPITDAATSVTKSIASGQSLTGALTSKLGDYVLIGVGVILALGALLIGSRDTIVNVSSKVSKTARMFV